MFYFYLPRTLIGEPPVEMEGIQQLDEDNLKQINDNLSTKYYYASEQQLNTPNEALQGDEATTQQNVQTTDLDEMDPSPMYFFRVTKFYLDPTFAHNNVNNKPSNNLRVSVPDYVYILLFCYWFYVYCLFY